MRERDELADAIHEYATRMDAPDRMMLADHLLARGWRKTPRVTTTEELDSLPLGSVVVDFAGTARTKRRGDSLMPGGWTAGGRLPLTSRELADGHQMTVVYAPEETL